MSSFARTLLAVMLSALIVTPEASAQLRGTAIDSGAAVPLSSAGPQATVDDQLRQMSGEAGVIFAGQVLAVRPQLDLALGAASGWVEIEFRIDQAIRGCLGQATYVLREWAGLWAAGKQRYTVGQRLLVLLHTPSASGLSSPVRGTQGIIPITGAGAAPRAKDRFVAAAEQAVDLRWVEAHLLRASATTQSAHAHPPSSLEPVYVGRRGVSPVNRKSSRPDAAAFRSESNSLQGAGLTPINFETSGTVPLSNATSQGITLRSVLAMLGAWEAEQAHAAR